MAEYEATIYYEAEDDAMANKLFDDMLDGLGCDDGPEHECPHFRLGFGPYEIAESRKFARWRLRRQLIDLARLAITGRL